MDDPWLWSADRVFKELCTPDRTWEPTTEIKALPNPEEFGKALLDEEVTGEALLQHVSDSDLKDLGLKKLGHRSFIRSAIGYLRSQSPRYIAHINRDAQMYQSAAGSSQIPILALPSHLSDRRISLMPNFPAMTTSPPQLQQQDCVLSTPADNRDGNFVHDETGNKRRKLNTDDSELEHEFQQPTGEDGLLAQNGEVIQDPMPPCPSTGTKRKRVAPTLITTELDPNRNRHLPTAADDVRHNDPANIEPGVPFVDDNGAKRLVPIHLPASQSEEPVNYMYGAFIQQQAPDHKEGDDTALEKRPRRHLDQTGQQKYAYLGKDKMPIDDIFYEGVALGEDIDLVEENVNFSQSPKYIPSGRRLYVYHALKRFLRSDPHVFSRDKKLYSAILPYPIYLVPTHKKPSFTLYHAGKDGKIHARREAIAAWPEVDPEALPPKGLDGERVTTFNMGDKPLVMYAETFDADDLEKYRHIPGGDELLPLYGESDEENEFDVETWEEIQKELAEKNKPALEMPLLSMKNPLLSQQVVFQVIDECLKDMRELWHREKKEKKERRAFRLWKRFHNPHDRFQKALRLEKLRADIAHFAKKRIPDLRNEIASEQWSSERAVRRQTQIMEASVFDHESRLWEMSIYESRTPPAKPPPKPEASIAASKKSAIFADEEEGESIGSDADPSSSEDDVDDFIDDDFVSAEEHELNLADVEEDDEMMSDDEGPSASPGKPPVPHGKNSQLSANSIGPDDDETSDAAKRAKSISGEQSRNATPLPSASSKSPTKAPSFAESLSAPKTPTKAMSPAGGPAVSVKKESHLSPPVARAQPVNNANEVIVLSSDPDVVNLITPVKKTKNKIKILNRGSPLVISESDVATRLPDKDNLPPYSNVRAIIKFDHQAWEDLNDRERLLIWVLYWMDDGDRKALFCTISGTTEEALWAGMEQLIQARLNREDESISTLDKDLIDIFETLIKLFRIFTKCKYLDLKDALTASALKRLLRKREKYFPEFCTFCKKLEGYFAGKHSTSSDKGKAVSLVDDDDEPQSAVKRRRKPTTSEEDLEEHTENDSPNKKRKKIVREDAAARDIRELDKNRQEEMRKRGEMLRARIAKDPIASQHNTVLNLGKLDDQGIISVHENVAEVIKPHQLEGVRFMWNQIVTDDKVSQGCLLAHTMGLGKTMQVITLLVAIANAARSTDESIYSQIPDKLRVSKTLVLCPPGLIDNWVDEMLTWSPLDEMDNNILGEVQIIKSVGMPAKNRLSIVANWYHEGGVLIVGYQMFSKLIHNKKNKKGVSPYSEEEHEELKKHLLEGPNIIVADEAHLMKNPTTSITKAATQFKSHTRIALTGSPLANNVAEYHTMIEFAAPGYLGPALEFRAKYVEPIQEGLYQDSSSHERRKALKMLGVLKTELDPKVHRADMSVLKKDLLPKKEFVITVPLTKVQRNAYSIYVNLILAGSHNVTKSGDIRQSTLWHWLAVLSLLCNHPECFSQKLNEGKTGKRTTGTKPSLEDEPQGLDINEPIEKVGVTPQLIAQINELFEAEAPDLKSIELSNKVKILCQILDACRDIGEKVLVFTSSIPTLNFLEELFIEQGRLYQRMDGSTVMNTRQARVKDFNVGEDEVYLLSTGAASIGLNMQGANRVVIFDFKFNPIVEEQAVGRAYRIGQTKPVYVYRFVAGGTFETKVHNTAIFKMQLASRVVDKKNTMAMATKKLGDYLFQPKNVEQEDLSEFANMDVVLDTVLATQSEESTIRSITQTDTYDQEDEDGLTATEEKEMKMMIADNILQRTDPVAYNAMIKKREAIEREKQRQLQLQQQHNYQQLQLQQQQLQQRNNHQQVQLPPAQENVMQHSAMGATVSTPQSSTSVRNEPSPSSDRARARITISSKVSFELRRLLYDTVKNSETTKNLDVDKINVKGVANAILQAFANREGIDGGNFQAIVMSGIEALKENPLKCQQLLTAPMPDGVRSTPPFSQFANSIPFVISGLPGGDSHYQGPPAEAQLPRALPPPSLSPSNTLGGSSALIPKSSTAPPASQRTSGNLSANDHTMTVVNSAIPQVPLDGPVVKEQQPSAMLSSTPKSSEPSPTTKNLEPAATISTPTLAQSSETTTNAESAAAVSTPTPVKSSEIPQNSKASEAPAISSIVVGKDPAGQENKPSNTSGIDSLQKSAMFQAMSSRPPIGSTSSPRASKYEMEVQIPMSPRKHSSQISADRLSSTPRALGGTTRSLKESVVSKNRKRQRRDSDSSDSPSPVSSRKSAQPTTPILPKWKATKAIREKARQSGQDRTSRGPSSSIPSRTATPSRKDTPSQN